MSVVLPVRNDQLARYKRVRVVQHRNGRNKNNGNNNGIVIVQATPSPFTMASINVTTSLPGKIIDDLVKAGAKVRKDCEIHIIELVDSEQASACYNEFLTSQNKDVDPILVPQFGNPMYPYQPPAIQNEVHRLLESFRLLTATHFAPDGPPIVAFPLPVPPPLLGYQYHHAQIAIQKVQQEIRNPTTMPAVCPGIVQVQSGQIITDLSIIYANCAVVQRLRKI